MYQNNLMQSGDQAVAVANEDSPLMRSISLRGLWAPIYRSRYAIIAIFVLMFSLAAIVTLLTQPRYRATATVEIRSETKKVLGTEDTDEAGASPTDAARFLDTQLQIIQSRSTATAVAQALGLAANNNFLDAMRGDTDDGVISPQERAKLVVEVLRSNLKVSFPKETRIADISFASPDPALSQRIANSYADSYIRLNLSRRFDASRYSLDFLRDQIHEAQQRLSQSERQTIDYARRARVIDASNGAGGSAQGAGGPQSLTTASLVSLNTALSEAITRRISAQERWELARSAPLLSIPEVVGNASVQQLQQQRAALQSQYQQELQTRREDYPSVRQLSARIREMDRQINTIASNVRMTLRQEYETAQAQEQALRSNIDQLKDTTLDEQDRTVQLSILRREANTDRQQLDALMKRYNELNAESGIQLNNLAVIDRADIPDGPYWPSVPLNVALALLLAVLVSVIYVLGRENLFDIVRTPDDVETRLRLPLLGVVPDDDDVLGAMANPKSAVSESFNSIRTSLSLASPGGTPQAFMVTSTQAGEGKSTACYALVQGLAKLGQSVILIDADLRRPNVHRLFGIQNGTGASNILTGSSSIDDCLLRNAAPNIDIITAGPIPPDATELLAGAQFSALITDLRARYDHVVIDSAPLLGLADAPLVASKVDGVIYVIQAAHTSVRNVQNAVGRLRQSGTPVIGVVLSRFDASQAGYSYEYKYAYDYSYGSSK